MEPSAQTAAPEQAAQTESRPAPIDNRELSWLDFNERVLELAEDDRTPLLERAKFLAIYESNLDEFFMVRVAGLHDQVDAGVSEPGADGLTPSETIDRLAERTRELDRRHMCCFEEVVKPQLAENGIRIVAAADCQGEELEELDRRFREQVFPALTPLGVGPGRPFPYISNLSMSIAVTLRDPANNQEGFARVKVPREVLPRFIQIAPQTFVPIEDVIARHLERLFPGMEVVSHAMFRVTRDADFTVSDDALDLVQAVEDELRRRRFGEVVRLEVSADMDPHMRDMLIHWLEVEERQVYDVEGLIDLGDLWELHGIEGHRDLRDQAWVPVIHPRFQHDEDEELDVFDRMRSGDILVHHPYDSFANSVERFIRQAVEDPDVLAIKMTVYRTSDDSALVPSLIEAAERGKQAVCLVELKARFDERRNIGWARALEESGAHVVHGLPGLKTHAKAVLVVRREGEGVRHYLHVGTGNYHAKTARLYEDVGLFTTDVDMANDVADLFNGLTGYARPRRFRKVIVSPAQTRNWFIEEVDRTIEAHEAGEHTRIAIKLNSLVDRRSIEALYRASQAGVQVDLNVRGICCLRPGVEGVSENIQVVSVVGRFLEHSRIYSFTRGDEVGCWIGSADLMPRNLDSRVELLAPVEDPQLRDELLATIDRCLADDTNAWELDADGRWTRRQGATRSAHRELMELHSKRAERPD